MAPDLVGQTRPSSRSSEQYDMDLVPSSDPAIIRSVEEDDLVPLRSLLQNIADYISEEDIEADLASLSNRVTELWRRIAAFRVSLGETADFIDVNMSVGANVELVLAAYADVEKLKDLAAPQKIETLEDFKEIGIELHKKLILLLAVCHHDEK